MRPDALRSLRDRVLAATSDDDALFHEVLEVLLLEWWKGEHRAAGARIEKFIRVGASLDAAVALCERVLPEWVWLVDSGGHPKPYAQIQRREHYGDPFVEPFLSEAATPALALVAACLSAKIAEMETGNGH